MAEVQIERERKNPVHKALMLILTHLAIQQPEAAKEIEKAKGALDDLFAPENQMTMPEPGLNQLQVEDIVEDIVNQKIAKFAATLPSPDKNQMTMPEPGLNQLQVEDIVNQKIAEFAATLPSPDKKGAK